MSITPKKSRARDAAVALSSTLSDAVVIVDRHGTVIFVNCAAEALLLRSADACFGEPVERIVRLVAEESSRPIESPVLEAMGHGEPARTNGSVLLECHDGSTIPVDALGVRLVESGHVAGGALIVRDLHRTRLLTEQLRRSQDDLERLAALAAGGRRSKDVAHQINNALTLIAGEAQSLNENEALAPGQRQQLERILDAVRRAASLTRILLNPERDDL